jgi:hypothetical protein
MTGPEHYQRAEELAAEARKLLGQGEGQDAAVAWAAVAQVHASLAVAAATRAGLQLRVERCCRHQAQRLMKDPNR